MDVQSTLAADLAPTVPGTPFEGGFYVGRLRVGADVFALIVAPKLEGEPPNRMRWGDYGQDVAGATSCFDGAANTAAMAEAGSELAKWMLAQQINGYADWYLPSRDELEMVYRYLKPTAETNYIYRGDNPSSLPAGYPYTRALPAQTTAEAFREGGAEALDDTWFWSSTQGSPHGSWVQDFANGGQVTTVKGSEARARALRRFKLSA